MKSMREMISLMEGVMAVPGLSQGSTGGAGGAEANMQTIGTNGRNQAYASFDASQGQATEEGIELGDETLGETAWYIVNGQGAVSSGPYQSEQEAKSASRGMQWFSENSHDILYGAEDENGYFVDPDGKSIASGDVMEKSTSEKQARFMAAAAHNPDFAKKADISQDVAKEFNQADKGTKQLSKAMKEAQVDTCRQSNPASADVACAMESNMSDTNYEQFSSRFNDLMNSYVEPAEAFEVIGREMDEMGIDGEEYDAIMSRLEDEFFPDQDGEPQGSFDMSDDADALASAGHGSDEDYGDYGGEFDEAFEKSSELDEARPTIDPNEIKSLMALDDASAKTRALEIVNTSSTNDTKKQYLSRQIDGARSKMEVIKLLYNMVLAGEGNAVQGSNYNNKFNMEEAFDLQNGYDDIEYADGKDYFPNGADSPVVKATGPSGARQGDNPEQKKMQVAEVHKELVYGYRNYLKESAKTK